MHPASTICAGPAEAVSKIGLFVLFKAWILQDCWDINKPTLETDAALLQDGLLMMDWVWLSYCCVGDEADKGETEDNKPMAPVDTSAEALRQSNPQDIVAQSEVTPSLELSDQITGWSTCACNHSMITFLVWQALYLLTLLSHCISNGDLEIFKWLADGYFTMRWT